MPGFGELWGHTGFVKAFMLYWPKQDAILCGTLNQSDAQGAFTRQCPVSAIIPACLEQLQYGYPGLIWNEKKNVDERFKFMHENGGSHPGEEWRPLSVY